MLLNRLYLYYMKFCLDHQGLFLAGGYWKG